VGGEWTEVLNTDAEQFGGSGSATGASRPSKGAQNGQPAYADVRVPPLGVLYLMPKAQEA
jgi:1,4-alpha-glucan branching enzyme